MAGWRAHVLTLYPEMFPGPLAFALAGRALREGIWSLDAVNIRDFATDKHGSVDDTPAGGGPGMVMRADVLADAIDGTPHAPGAPIICLSPRGAPVTQERVRKLADGPGALLICGRFEGIDERVLDARPIEQLSLGDFVLAGGEMAAFSLLDAVVRLLPGVVGDGASLAFESFEDGLLEHPHYTRPQIWEDRAIPQVLLSGDHGKIHAWRQAQAEEVTRQRRPDLWALYTSRTKAGRNKAGLVETD